MHDLINAIFGKNPVSRDQLQLDIVARLKETGYECHMNEGNINVKRNERWWEVYMTDANNPYIKRVMFQDCFSVTHNPEELDPAEASLLMEVVNNEYHVKVRGHQGNYAATYETAIASVQDFMAEFSDAWPRLMEPIQAMKKGWEKMVKDHSANSPDKSAGEEHKIGFRAKQLAGERLRRT